MGAVSQCRPGRYCMIGTGWCTTDYDSRIGVRKPRVCARAQGVPRHSGRGDERDVHGRSSSDAELLTSSTRYMTFYPNGPKESDSLGRIVSKAHAQRIKNLVDNTKGTIVFGGDADVTQKYIAPTLVKDVRGDDSLMSECVPLQSICTNDSRGA